ncbi:hypothetical protein MTX20_16290 [Bradyrhizobium sp. ISRA435]|nr:hypothetical protein MTX20_16290 [Bradyrhizobium sp. ISRA435]
MISASRVRGPEHAISFADEQAAIDQHLLDLADLLRAQVHDRNATAAAAMAEARPRSDRDHVDNAAVAIEEHHFILDDEEAVVAIKWEHVDQRGEGGDRHDVEPRRHHHAPVNRKVDRVDVHARRVARRQHGALDRALLLRRHGAPGLGLDRRVRLGLSGCTGLTLGLTGGLPGVHPALRRTRLLSGRACRALAGSWALACRCARALALARRGALTSVRGTSAVLRLLLLALPRATTLAGFRSASLLALVAALSYGLLLPALTALTLPFASLLCAPGLPGGLALHASAALGCATAHLPLVLACCSSAFSRALSPAFRHASAARRTRRTSVHCAAGTSG